MGGASLLGERHISARHRGKLHRFVSLLIILHKMPWRLLVTNA
mgnify:CR=1 FL=1